MAHEYDNHSVLVIIQSLYNGTDTDTVLYYILFLPINTILKIKNKKGAHWAVLAAGRRARSSRRVFWSDPLHPPSDAGNTSGPCFGVPEVSQIQSPAQTVLLDPGNQADRTVRRRFLSCWQNYSTTLLLWMFVWLLLLLWTSLTFCWQLLPVVLVPWGNLP